MSKATEQPSFEERAHTRLATLREEYQQGQELFAQLEDRRNKVLTRLIGLEKSIADMAALVGEPAAAPAVAPDA